MRVILKDIDSNRYSDGNGAWVGVPEGAFDFASTDCAIEFVLNSDLAGLQMALYFIEAEVLLIFHLPTDIPALKSLLRQSRTSTLPNDDLLIGSVIAD